MPKPQFKVLLSDQTIRALDSQRKELGFHNANALSAVYLTTLSELPPHRVWEALATLQKHRLKNRKSP